MVAITLSDNDLVARDIILSILSSIYYTGKHFTVH
jgi:hypothetical protein